MTEDLSSSLLGHVIELKQQMGGALEMMNRHDKVDFPLIKQTLTRIESKHNQDYLQFIKEKESLNERMLPLEQDYEKRKKTTDEVKKNSLSIVWDLIKMGVLTVIGYLIATWQHVFN